MGCHRYASGLICIIFKIIPSGFGTFLIPLSTMQMYREWSAWRHSQVAAGDFHQQIQQGEHVGPLTKDIHHTVFGCSPIYMIGWLLNTTMNNAIELYIADIFIDVVTISLAYILWIIADEKVGLWYFAKTGIIPRRPRQMIDLLLWISIAWVFVNNFINYFIDRLWPRAFFFFYLALIFAFGICLLTGLVLRLAIQSRSLPNKWLCALVIVVCVMGAIAIPSQIKDGLNHIRDTDTKFYAELPEDRVPFSLIFMAVQGLMLVAGVIHSWIKPRRDDAYHAV